MNISIATAKMFLANKKAKHQRLLDNKYELALHDFNNIKMMIIESYNPKRIYQWGSLLDQSRFREYSDIDIAVDGIDDPATFFRMFGDAEKMTQFPLDLVDINKIETEFAELIKSRGRIVYEHRD